MGDKQFIIWLSDKDYILVIIKSKMRVVTSYVIKYMANINAIDYEVARFDSGHDYQHVDVLRPDGTKERVIHFPSIHREQAIDFAIENFKLHFDLYRERFIKWLKG